MILTIDPRSSSLKNLKVSILLDFNPSKLLDECQIWVFFNLCVDSDCKGIEWIIMGSIFQNNKRLYLG